MRIEHDEQVPRRVGPFLLRGRLGQGGFGEVHLGEDDQGRRAAVKLLHPTLTADTEMRRRFVTELSEARKVSGFCVAEILDADPEASQPWIATEYIDGPTLHDAVTTHGPRSGADLQRLAVATATALAAIHAAGVVHRDLKPENIMLAPDGPRVIDFGIARGLEATSVTASGVIGTVGYMAPEQLEGTRVGPAADIFAWGAVIVFAATGREAFPGGSQAARITRVLTGEPETGPLPEPLASAVHSALSKDPAQRPDAESLMTRLIAPASSAQQAPGALPPQDTARTADGPAGATAALPGAQDTGATRVEGADGTAVIQDGSTRLYTEVAPPGVAEQSAPPAAPGRQTPPASGARQGPGTPAHTGAIPPYYFQGLRCADPATLAEAMQRDWQAAVRLFSDPQGLDALGAWLVEDLQDTTVDRRLFRQRPSDVHVAVADFIAQANPALDPVFRGHDARPEGLARLFNDPRPVLTGGRASGELLLLARPEVLRILGRHKGQERLSELADALTRAGQEAQVLLDRLRELQGFREVNKAADSALMLTFLLHPELIAQPVFQDPKAEEWGRALWAVVPEGGGPAPAGRAAAVYAVTDVLTEVGNQHRTWELRLHDAKQEREKAKESYTLWRWLHPAHVWARRGGLVLLLAGLAVNLAAGALDAPEWLIVLSGLAFSAGVLVVPAGFLVRMFDRPKDGYPSRYHAVHAKYYHLSQQLPQLESGVTTINQDLATLRRIAAEM